MAPHRGAKSKRSRTGRWRTRRGTAMPAPACVYRTPLTRRDLPPVRSNGVPLGSARILRPSTAIWSRPAARRP